MSVKAWALSLVLAGCGVDAEAPAPLNAPAPATCPALPDLAPTLFALLDGHRLPGVQRLVGEVLTDAQITTLLDTVLRLLRGLDPADRDALLALASDPRLAQLLPVVAQAVRFVAGDGRSCPPADPLVSSGGNCFHTEVFADLRRLLRVCDGEALFGAVRAVLEAPVLPDLIAQLGGALALPPVQQVLDASEGFSLRRRGFTALVCNVLAAMVQPGFTVEASIIQPLSGITLLPLDEPPLSALLTDLATLLDPNETVLPALADVICCDVYGVSSCAALPATAQPLLRDPVFTWLVHELLTAPSLDLGGLLTQLTALAADPDLARALAPLGAVVGPLAEDPEIRRGLVALVDVLLREDVAREVLPEVALLLEVGALPELLAIVDALLAGCTP